MVTISSIGARFRAIGARFPAPTPIFPAAVAVIVSVALSCAISAWIVFGMPSAAKTTATSGDGAVSRLVAATALDKRGASEPSDLTARFGFADPGDLGVATVVTAPRNAEQTRPVAAHDTITFLSGRVEGQSLSGKTLPAEAPPATQFASAEPMISETVRRETRSAQASRPAVLNASATAFDLTPTRTPIMRLDLPRLPQSGVFRAEMPINLDTTNNRNDHLLIGRVPAGVHFTKGQTSGLGLWQMSVAEFRESQIVVEPTAPAAFQMTFMLLDRNSTVVNGLDIAFRQVDQSPTVVAGPNAQTAPRVGVSTAATSAKRWSAKTDVAPVRVLRGERKAVQWRDNREARLNRPITALAPPTARLAGPVAPRPVARISPR